MCSSCRPHANTVPLCPRLSQGPRRTEPSNRGTDRITGLPRNTYPPDASNGASGTSRYRLRDSLEQALCARAPPSTVGGPIRGEIVAQPSQVFRGNRRVGNTQNALCGPISRESTLRQVGPVVPLILRPTSAAEEDENVYPGVSHMISTRCQSGRHFFPSHDHRASVESVRNQQKPDY